MRELQWKIKTYISILEQKPHISHLLNWNTKRLRIRDTIIQTYIYIYIYTKNAIRMNIFMHNNTSSRSSSSIVINTIIIFYILVLVHHTTIVYVNSQCQSQFAGCADGVEDVPTEIFALSPSPSSIPLIAAENTHKC